MAKSVLEDLAKVDLLAGLGPAELAAVATRLRVRSFDPDELILAYHDRGHDVGFVLSGVVEVSVVNRSGRQTTFRELRAGASFGELSAIDGGARSADVTAKKRSTIAFISAAEFRAMLDERPAVREATFRKLVHFVRSLSERVAELSLVVARRTGKELVRMARDAGTATRDVRILPNREDFASRIDTTREQVSRALAELEQLGLLRRVGREVVIADLTRIEAWVDGA
ncbi:MAG: Crp/Fnr family transcriptional regulator [Geminicoccaceae bacterium]